MNLPKEIQDDLVTILEAARVALTPYTSSFDQLTEELDLADEELSRIHAALDRYLNTED